MRQTIRPGVNRSELSGYVGDQPGTMVTHEADIPPRLDWATLLDIAVGHVRNEKNVVGLSPTLRRLHYLLVSDAAAVALGYRNTQANYKSLSAHTAKARDAATFPQLIDQTRTIHHADGYTNPAQILKESALFFSIDRAALMPVNVILIAEKDGIVPVLRSRFDWLTVSATRGYASVSHAGKIAHLADPDRDTIGLYLGDYDPTGLDIDRALAARMPFPLRRVGLSREQVAEHNLPPMPAKNNDSRCDRMVESQGAAMQVELDALPTTILLDLIATAITDVSGVELRADGQPDWPEVDAQESDYRQQLIDLSESFGGGQ